MSVIHHLLGDPSRSFGMTERHYRGLAIRRGDLNRAEQVRFKNFAGSSMT
jgi:hypothetical protein